MGRVYVGPALGFTSFYLRLLSHSLFLLFTRSSVGGVCMDGAAECMGHGAESKWRPIWLVYLSIQGQTTSVSVELNPVNCRQTNSSQVRRATGCFRWVG